MRPDKLVARYFTDYIRVAGTYPCDSSLINTGMCTRYRPVTAVHVGPTRVVAHHFLPFTPAHVLEAFVAFRIDYVDGQYTESVFALFAERSQPYFRTRIHATCWFFSETFTLYPNIVSPIPPGLAYYNEHDVTPGCSGESQHV